MSSSLVKHSKRTLRQPCRKCGASDLYWAHDTAVPDDKGVCKDCDVAGKYVLMDKDGGRHLCEPFQPKAIEAAPAVIDAEPIPSKEEPMPVPAAVVAPTASDNTDAALMALRTLLAPPAIDESAVRAIVADMVDATLFPTRTVIVRDSVSRTIEGDTHKSLADVVTALLSGEHVMMVGPAGTGKSTIAEQAADALGLASYSLSLSPQTPASSIIGYMQATGDYVSTLFRQAYENGGLFHFDEVDNSHPSVLAVINAALANGHMAFPDGMVKRHADFRAVASANTYGKGATRQYVGRQAMDAATLDRFTVLTIDIDETLERALCHAQTDDAKTVERVLAYVRRIRKNATDKGLNVVVSPRASVGMVRLVSAGMSWEMAVDARVRRGLSDADWAKLTA